MVVRRELRGALEQREVELEARHALEVPAGGHARVQLAEPAGGLAADQHARGAAGVQERLARRLDAPRRRGSRPAPPPAPPWRRRSRPAAARARATWPAAGAPVSSAPRCVCSSGSASRAARPAAGGRSRRRRPRTAARRAARASGCGARRPAASRAASCAASPAPRTSGCAARDDVRRRAGAAGREVGRGEALAHRLVDSPRADQRVLEAAAGALRRAPGGRWRRGGWAAWTGACPAPRCARPPRSGRPRGVTSLRRKPGTVTSSPSSASATPNPSASRIRRSPRAARGCRAAARPSRRAGGSWAAAAGAPPTSIVPVREARAGQLEHQLGREDLPVHRLLGRDPLLEARGRLRAQLQLRRRALEVRAVPVRRLHQHARGRAAHLGALAAHDPGDARRALVVADDQDVGVERAVDVVERRHRPRPLARGARPGARRRRGRSRTRAAAGR